MPLINDIKDLKAQLGGVQLNMHWETWRPFVAQAETKFILPVIGRELYDDIVLSTLTSGPKFVFKLWLKMATAQYTYLVSLAQMSVVTGDSGIVGPAPTNTDALKLWQFQNLETKTAAAADDLLEEALDFLQENLAAKNPDGTLVFEVYLNSKAHREQRELFFFSANQMTPFFPPMQNSRRLFIALKDYIRRSEIDFIEAIIGEALFTVLKEKTRNSEATFTRKEQAVLDIIRQALAYHAFASSLRFLNFGENFKLVSAVGPQMNNSVRDEAKLSQMKIECEAVYNRWANKLTDYLNKTATATVLPEYFNSELYPKKGEPTNAADRYSKRFDTEKNYVIL